MTDFLSTEEIGERMGVSARRVQELAKAGHIPSVRHGRSIRIPRLAWETYLQDQSEQALSSLAKGLGHANAV